MDANSIISAWYVLGLGLAFYMMPFLICGHAQTSARSALSSFSTYFPDGLSLAGWRRLYGRACRSEGSSRTQWLKIE